jgi:hypothetical protein
MTSTPDRPVRATRPNPLVNSWTFLAIASLAAWFPVCRPYLRVADDFHFAKWLLAGGIPVYFHEDGVWRILGHELIHSAVMANPLLPGILAIVTHGIASILFLLVLRQILSSEPLALVLALLFAVFPWGDEVMMWASAYTYMLGATFFLAVLCLLLRAFPLNNTCSVLLTVLCAALSLFSHEALFFALLVSGAVVLVRDDGFSVIQRLALAAAPVAGCAIWWVLYKAFPGRMPTEHVALNPRTLLSGILYQYTNWEIFEPWFSRSTRTLLFFDWSHWQFAAAVVLLCAVVFRAIRVRPLSPTNPLQAAAKNGMLLYLLLLLVAMVAIYAFGGGFSLDSRKKYPIIPVLLLCVGYAIDRFAPRLRIPPSAILAVVLCGIATTWLQIGLWRYEATRLDLLVDFLRTQRNPGDVRVEWDSRIQQAWPRSTRHWGMPVESWVLKNGVELKALLLPPVAFAPPVPAVKFDPIQFAWEPADQSP